MYKYVNNRVGTTLNDQEAEKIKINPTILNKGDIIVYEKDDIKKFGIYLKKDDASNTHTIIFKEDADDSVPEEKSSIPQHGIYEYAKGYHLQQIFKFNESNLNEEDLLETYIVK
jgi:hypothetical protein